jgi:hypothetical protein
MNYGLVIYIYIFMLSNTSWPNWCIRIPFGYSYHFYDSINYIPINIFFLKFSFLGELESQCYNLRSRLNILSSFLSHFLSLSVLHALTHTHIPDTILVVSVELFRPNSLIHLNCRFPAHTSICKRRLASIFKNEESFFWSRRVQQNSKTERHRYVRKNTDQIKWLSF